MYRSAELTSMRTVTVAYDELVSRESRLRRVGSTIYEASAGNPLFNGPLWLRVLFALVIAVEVFLGTNPWRLVVLPILLLFWWLPLIVRWGAAISKMPRAFRDGLRDK